MIAISRRRQRRPALVSGLQAAAVAMILGTLAGCTAQEASLTEPQTMVMVDIRTREAFQLPVVGQFPALNPNTGKRTLMPALYCPSCAAWHPVPGPDQINHRPGASVCPKTHTPLVGEGPLPGSAQSSSAHRKTDGA